MLKPTFSERTALEIRERIIRWLRNHFTDKSNWTPYGLSNHRPSDCHESFEYQYPIVRDFSDSGGFDDTAESIFLRVLKDMNNFGTISLNRNRQDPRTASSQVVLGNRFLEPLPEGVSIHSNQMYYVSELLTLDSLK